MTNERAAQALERLMTIPGDGFTFNEMSEAMRMGANALRAQRRQPNEPLTGLLKIGDSFHGMKIIALDALAGTITLSGWKPFHCKLGQEE